jgi:hypothetical protein
MDADRFGPVPPSIAAEPKLKGNNSGNPLPPPAQAWTRPPKEETPVEKFPVKNFVEDKVREVNTPPQEYQQVDPEGFGPQGVRTIIPANTSQADPVPRDEFRP